MLARPRGQSDLLTEMPAGVEFIRRVNERFAEYGQRPRLRTVS